MIDFGFTLSPSSRINLDKADTAAWERLAEAAPDVRQCIACGSCTASCPAGVYRHNSLRSCLLALQNGQKEEALSLVEACLLCGKCTLVCPRSLNTRLILLSIQKTYAQP